MYNNRTTTRTTRAFLDRYSLIRLRAVIHSNMVTSQTGHEDHNNNNVI